MNWMIGGCLILELFTCTQAKYSVHDTVQVYGHTGVVTKVTTYPEASAKYHIVLPDGVEIIFYEENISD